MNDIKLLIFDWDGTLMDSVQHIVDSLNAAIQQLDLAPRHHDDLKNVIGLGMREAIAAIYPDQVDDAFAAQFVEAYREYFFAEDARQSMFAGARETLQQLQSQNYVLAVATGKSRHGLNHALSDTGLHGMFVESRCADETRSKPDPLMLEEILESLNMKAQHAIMIGDTEYDLAMARAAGVHPLGVSYGVHDRERLQKHKPVHILDAIQELPGWLSSQRLS